MENKITPVEFLKLVANEAKLKQVTQSAMLQRFCKDLLTSVVVLLKVFIF